MSENKKCELCSKPASQTCGGCHKVYYCSKEHQKNAWKKHKAGCRPFKIASNETLGRFLAATRNIKAGDIILSESALVWGPPQITEPICLGCGKILEENKVTPCSKCGWPMCSDSCEKSPSHIPECRYTVSRGDKVTVKNFQIVHPIYQGIIILRCLYMKQFLPKLWEKINALQSHCEQRKGTLKYENEKATIVQFIRKFFKLENVFDEEEILRISGIVMVNGHEVPVTEPPYVAIYDLTSMFEHNCSANCCKSFKKNGDILIIAGQDIQKGDHLTICYTDPLWGTPNRRHHLYESKFFWCHCSRCSDSTEFGTYFSALQCQNKDCKGCLLPESFIENEEKNKNSDWKCNICKTAISNYSAQDILERTGRDLSEMEKGSVDACKEFISKSLAYLHSQHYYIVDVKFALLQLIGQGVNSNLSLLSNEDIHMKYTYCEELIQLANKLFPGERRIKGLILFELQTACFEIGKRRAAIENDPGYMQEALLKARHYLAECIKLLKNEPIILPEGKICRQAQQNLKDIDILLSKGLNYNKIK